MYNLISITCCSTFDVVNIPRRQRSCVSSIPIFVLLFSTFVGTNCIGSCAKLTNHTCLKSIEPPLSSQVDRLMRSSLSKQSKLCWTEPQNGVARSRVQVKFGNAYNNSYLDSISILAYIADVKLYFHMSRFFF